MLENVKFALEWQKIQILSKIIIIHWKNKRHDFQLTSGGYRLSLLNRSLLFSYFSFCQCNLKMAWDIWLATAISDMHSNPNRFYSSLRKTLKTNEKGKEKKLKLIIKNRLSMNNINSNRNKTVAIIVIHNV